MAVNYDDARFQQVTQQQNQALQNLNNTYNNMINQSQKFYDAQVKAAEDYGNQQKALQQQNTDFTIQKIEQQKERAEQDYTKEQKGAYVDWQKQSNQYGVNAEEMASRGLRNGGYSESSQVSMYNQYQNRVGQARESYNRAVQDYDNSITEARLTNSAKLAEIAYNSLKTKLELNLNGFQYKNNLLAQQISETQKLQDNYYNRWQDVLKQINYENEQAENQRRYEEQMAAQRAAQQTSERVYSGIKDNNNNPVINIKGDEEVTAKTVKINGVTYTPTGNYADNGSPIYRSGNKLYYYNGKDMIYGGNASGQNSNQMSFMEAIKQYNKKLKTTADKKIASLGSLVSGGGRHG